jgi:hypothetical protein
MERREILTLGAVGLAASVSAFWLWKWRKTQPELESPRGLSIQRASLRTTTTRSFNDEHDTLVEEGPTILNALYMYAQDEAKLGRPVLLISRCCYSSLNHL